MPEIIQFDKSEIVSSGKNIAGSASYGQPVYFNESYIVTGDLKAPKVHGSYDLIVLGDLMADEIEVRGKLTVTGKISALTLNVEKSLACEGEIASRRIIVSGNLQAESIYCDVLNCSGSIVVQTIAEISKELEAQNIFVALEGIIGNGNMCSSKVITGEYFEFEGEVNGRVIDLGTESTSEDYIEEFKNKISDELQKNGDMDEEHLSKFVHKIAELDHSYWCEWADLIDKIIDISYDDRIQNFRDYLLILYASRIFPKEITSYETLNHVFQKMFKEAQENCAEMGYFAQNIEEVSQSIRIISYCEDLLTIDKNDALDKVFQSIGIKYKTVERFLEPK